MSKSGQQDLTLCLPVGENPTVTLKSLVGFPVPLILLPDSFFFLGLEYPSLGVRHCPSVLTGAQDAGLLVQVLLSFSFC